MYTYHLSRLLLRALTLHVATKLCEEKNITNILAFALRSLNFVTLNFIMSEQGPPGPMLQQQSPGPSAVGPLPPPGQENLSALQRAIDSMEEKGLQEDPR